MGPLSNDTISSECGFGRNSSNSNFISNFNFNECSTGIELGTEFIIYSNTISYKDQFSTISFFHGFSVSCKVKKLGKSSKKKFGTGKSILYLAPFL